MLPQVTQLSVWSLLSGLAILCLSYLFYRNRSPSSSDTAPKRAESEKSGSKMAQSNSGPSIMSQPASHLNPPKDDPFTPAQLAQFDGSDSSRPIYVAIKGKVFDVSGKRDMYGPGAGYNVFAGKDASRGLGMSSLDPKDAVADYSSLNEAQRKTLDQWESFFEKRYNIVGQVQH